MTALHRGSRHNPATFAHTHAWKLPEHGGVNATGMTKQPYRCLINSNLYAERGLFSEKPGGKKKKSLLVQFIWCFVFECPWCKTACYHLWRLKTIPSYCSAGYFQRNSHSKKFMHRWKQIKNNARWLWGNQGPLVSGSLETISSRQGPLKSLERAPGRTRWQIFSSCSEVRLWEDFAHHLHFVVFGVSPNCPDLIVRDTAFLFVFQLELQGKQ